MKFEDGDVANFGALLRTTGRTKEALEFYIDYIKPERKYEWALLLNATNCAIELGQQRWQRWIEQGIVHHPENYELKRAKARVLRLMGKNKAAMQILKGIMNKQGQELECCLEIGSILYEENSKNDAINYFLRANSIDKQDGRGLANAIKTTEEIGDKKRVDDLVKQALRQHGDNSDIKAALAYNHLQRHEYNESANIYKGLCSEDINNKTFWINLTASLRGLKQPNAAIRTVKNAYQIHPTDRQVKHTLVQCLTEAGNHSAAKIAIEMILEDIKLDQDKEIYNYSF